MRKTVINVICIFILLFAVNTASAQEAIDVPQVSIVPTTVPIVDVHTQSIIDMRMNALELKEYINHKTGVMIDRIDKMLMWVLGLGTFIIAVVALIGGYLVWNNAQFRKQAQADLDAIRTSKEQADKVLVEVKGINTQFLSNVSAVTTNLNKTIEEVKSISELKKIAQRSVQEIENYNVIFIAQICP